MGRELLPNSRAEQLTQNRHVEMAMDAAPSATLEVIQTKLLFGFAKAVFDGPASESHTQQLAKRPAVASRHAVREKVLRFVGQHIACHNKRTLVTDELVGVRLSPTSVPANLPNLAAAMRVLDTITLSILLAKRGGVFRKILDFTGLSISAAQTGVLFRTTGVVLRRLFQHLGLCKPYVRMRGNLDNERFSTRIQSIEKLAVVAIQFVGRPRHHLDTVGFRPVDQVQRDLRFRFEIDFVGDVRFFRRAESSIHSLGRYSWASSRQSKPGAE